MNDSPRNVVALVPYTEPCIEVSKLRSVDDAGAFVFDRWCYVHSHWLNDGPRVETVVEKMVRELRDMR
jgi:hypothetical protein